MDESCLVCVWSPLSLGDALGRLHPAGSLEGEIGEVQASELSGHQPCNRYPNISGRFCYTFRMSTEQIVALLVAERDRLSRAIEALQGPTKRRGRPPKNPLAITSTIVAAEPAPKKRKFSPAQRKAQAAKMKAYWKTRKAEAASA